MESPRQESWNNPTAALGWNGVIKEAEAPSAAKGAALGIPWH
jgi:hypothetical protein